MIESELAQVSELTLVLFRHLDSYAHVAKILRLQATSQMISNSIERGGTNDHSKILCRSLQKDLRSRFATSSGPEGSLFPSVRCNMMSRLLDSV